MAVWMAGDLLGLFGATALLPDPPSADDALPFLLPLRALAAAGAFFPRVPLRHVREER